MTTPTGDQALIKRINTAIVLESILRGAPLSRAQISEQTGLNKATVSSLVQDLIDGSLVREIGTGQSSGGRKPVMLEFVAASGYAIGIDLGVNYVRGALVDMRGVILAEQTSPLRDSEQEAVFEQLCGCVEALIAEAPPSPYGIVGIGAGVPGIVDEHGTILFAPNLQWRDIPLQRMLTERFGLPVIIDEAHGTTAKGRTRYDAPEIDGSVHIQSRRPLRTGDIVTVKIEASDAYDLHGMAV